MDQEIVTNDLYVDNIYSKTDGKTININSKLNQTTPLSLNYGGANLNSTTSVTLSLDSGSNITNSGAWSVLPTHNFTASTSDGALTYTGSISDNLLFNANISFSGNTASHNYVFYINNLGQIAVSSQQIEVNTTGVNYNVSLSCIQNSVANTTYTIFVQDLTGSSVLTINNVSFIAIGTIPN